MHKVDGCSTIMGEDSTLSREYTLHVYLKYSTFIIVKDHHANMSITHKCVDGVDLELEIFSFEANELTQKDVDAAKAIDLVYTDNPIKMSDYSYDLKHDSIALFPAEHRGGSKLLRVDSAGKVSYFNHFGKSISALLDGCHVVFNNSRVLNARLLVESEGDTVELMVRAGSFFQSTL